LSTDPETGHELLWERRSHLLPALITLISRESPPPKNLKNPGPTPDPDNAMLALKNFAFNKLHASDLLAFPGLADAVLAAARNPANSRPFRGDAFAFFNNLMVDEELCPDIMRYPGVMPALLDTFADPISAGVSASPDHEPILITSACLCTLAGSVPGFAHATPNATDVLAGVLVRAINEDGDLKDEDDCAFATFIASEALDVVLAMTRWEEGKTAIKESTVLVDALTNVRDAYSLDPNVRAKSHGALFEAGLEPSRAFFFAGVSR